jgi:hypothetical protein
MEKTMAVENQEVMMGCISESFHLLGNAVLEQTVRALLTK